MAKLVCTIELSKERGVTIKVENAEGKITQTITLDGTTLTMKVVGEQETSSWTQTADAIAIACKDFTLAASNSITCTAAKTATYKSTDSDTTIESGAKLIGKATGDVEISGANTTIEATSAAGMKGATASVEATSSLTLEGTSDATLSGAQVKVSADAQLSLESSGLAKLEGLTTTIGGSVIKAG